MRGLALLCALLLAGGTGDGAAQPSPALASPSATAPVNDAVHSSEYTVQGHALRLVSEKGKCAVEHHRVGQTQTTKLELDLGPPCHMLTWRSLPPTRSRTTGVSDGVPVGTRGDAMAWRYASADGVVTLAIIGDPVPQELRSGSLYRLRERQGMSCASSVQALLLHPGEVRLSTKREHAGVFCAELGLEEKDFWRLAHP
jgi:hypothetical protein